MKNITKVLIACAAFSGLLFFSGCTLPFLPKPKTDDQKITLKYWGLWEPKTNFQALIDDYQKSHPNITIQYEERSPKFYYETLKSKLIGGNGPDLFRMHMSWVPKLTEFGLSPLPTSIMDENTYKSTFYPSVVTWCTVANQRYCLPLMYDGLALVYNTDLFQKAGISRPPKTWEEFRDYAKKLTVKTDGQVTQAGAAIGDESVTEYTDLIGLLMLQNGAVMQDAKTGAVSFQKTISQDGRNTGAEALDFYTMFATGDSKVWDKSLGESTMAFAAGKVGMIFASSWRVQNVLSNNPSLKIAVAPVPQLPVSDGGMTNINWASFWVEGVSAKSAHPAEAWDFLNYLTQREQLLNLQKATTASSAGRLFGEINPRVDMASTMLSDQYVGTYVASAPSAQSWYFCDRTWDEKLNDQVKAALSSAVKATVSGADPAGSLNAAAAVVEGILAKKDEELLN